MRLNQTKFVVVLRPKSCFLFTVFLACVCAFGHAQKAAFIENKGQWEEHIRYKFPLGNGDLWMEAKGWTISVLETEGLAHAMHEVHANQIEDSLVNGHAIKVQLVNANPKPEVEGLKTLTTYLNYFLGNDKSRWQGHVPMHAEVMYRQVYDGVDLLVERTAGRPKMTYIIEPFKSSDQVVLSYEGQHAIRVDDNRIVIQTSVGDIVEEELEAFQIINGQRKSVKCKFRLRGNQVSFNVGKYDESLPLYIDPTIIASTNSGCVSEAWGHSSTFSAEGHVYSAGRCFQVGYPVTIGAFQVNFAGPFTTAQPPNPLYYLAHDMCLSKYDQDGSTLIYATYIGGVGQESPHSIIANTQDHIVVLGSTNSVDFPVSPLAFDTSYNGSSDIVVFALSSDGSQLIGGTYIGGAGKDGLANDTVFYADDFRGEVVLDSLDNVYIASFTQSSDFPASFGAFQDSLSGGQDGVVCKLNPDLSTLFWATYLGGSESDATYALKVDPSLAVYVAGTTASLNFPVDSSGAHPVYIGGNKDAFVIKLSSSGQEVVKGSFFGTAFKDQNYLIELGFDGVYLFGTSNGGITATAGKYEGPGSGGYIYKTPFDLDTIEWVSSFGQMTPAAFLVDVCDRIYASGQGALSALNLASFDTLEPVLNLAQGGFYLMKLNPGAEDLEFGSFYGNNASHVDGGTSRFDKRGVVYQATCSNGAFPTVNWAYSATNQTAGATYDNTVFKIDFASNIAKALIEPDDTVCAPIVIEFDNAGSVGNVHYWSFGDGTFSNDSTPVHAYDSAGTFEVFYVISDSLGCYGQDTAFVELNVVEPIVPAIELGDTICRDSVLLSVDPALFSGYAWSTGQTDSAIYVYAEGDYHVTATANLYCQNADTIVVTFLEAYHFDLPDTGICDLGFPIFGPASALTYEWSTGDTTPTTTVAETGTYFLTASNGECFQTESMEVAVSYVNFGTLDTTTCADSLLLQVQQGGGSVLWNTAETTSTIDVSVSGTYWVRVSNGFCISSDTITVVFNPPLVDLGPDQVVCEPTSVHAIGSAEGYKWSNGDTTQTISVDSSMTIWVDVSEGDCVDRDSIKVEVQDLRFKAPLPKLCDADSAMISAPTWKGAKYQWFNGDTLGSTWVYQTGAYWLKMQTDFCENVDTIRPRFIETPGFSLGPDTSICIGETLSVASDTTFGETHWSTGDTGLYITLLQSESIWAYQDFDGCPVYDTVEVEVRQLWSDSFALINNIMTPNGDGLNEELRFHMADPSLFDNYSLKVYDRWGLKMFETTDLNEAWDGTNRTGNPVAEGTYFYIMQCETQCLQRPYIEVKDNVTVLR